MLCAFWSLLDERSDTDGAVQSSMTSDIASSVGARGFMLCNRHQAPRTFLALDAPMQFAVQRAVEANQQQVAAVARQVHVQGPAALLGLRVWASQLLPTAKRLCGLAPVHAALALLPQQWSTVCVWACGVCMQCCDCWHALWCRCLRSRW